MFTNFFGILFIVLLRFGDFVGVTYRLNLPEVPKEVTPVEVAPSHMLTCDITVLPE